MVTAGAQSIPKLLLNTQELLLSESQASLRVDTQHCSPCSFPGGFKTKVGSTPGGYALGMVVSQQTFTYLPFSPLSA